MSRDIPSRLEMEQAIIGGCLLSAEHVDKATEKLRPEHFWDPRHGMVFAAILDLANRGARVEPLTVADILARRDELDVCGGNWQLVAWQADAPVVSSMDRACEVVLDMARLRALIDAGTRIVEVGYSGAADTSEALQRSERLLSEAFTVGSGDDLIESFADLSDEMLADLMDDTKRSKPVGVSTGLRSLDAIIDGLEPGALIVVGGRPGMGKTVLACKLARAVAMDSGQPVLYVSLEMSKQALLLRMYAGELRVDHGRMKRRELHQLEREKLSEVPMIKQAPIVIDKSASIAAIRSQARRVKRSHGDLGLIVVDYVQLMIGRSGTENRQTEVAEISRSLKVLAGEMNCPVVALAALNRSLESRSDKRPILSDLRESGALESDADVVLFTYRDEVYDENTQDEGVIELIVGKHRSGPTGTARASWMGRFQTIEDFANLEAAS